MERTRRIREPSKFQSALAPILWVLLGPPIAWAVVVMVWVLLQEANRAFNG